jgi:negative regulator of flagellin synthesis FlgM
MKPEAVMVNQITSNITQLRGIGDQDGARGAKGASSGAISKLGGAERVDSVSLSTAARSLPAEMTKGPPIDTALVTHLSAEIAAGRYPIDANKIADALSSQVSLLSD